ncbi:MAG: class I SAM-dependent methyltransferase, partial [Pseudomonadota bacterium]
MRGRSRNIESSQSGVHTNLEKVLRRHVESNYAKPFSEHTGTAFKQLTNLINRNAKPIILDSGCGTGLASILLAERHPDHWVIGLDKSVHRLDKHRAEAAPPNL